MATQYAAAQSTDDQEVMAYCYDSIPKFESQKDIAFYLEIAKDVRSDILEIGCGTGRILMPILARGQSVTGVDRNSAMLTICKNKIGKLPVEQRGRASLVCANMTSLALAKRFDMVLMPFRPLQYLLSIEDQIRGLSRIAAHLNDGASLVFDVSHQNLWSRIGEIPSPEYEDVPSFTLPDGCMCRRKFRFLKK